MRASAGSFSGRAWHRSRRRAAAISWCRGFPAVRRSKPSWSRRICRSRWPPWSSAHTETAAAECIRIRAVAKPEQQQTAVIVPLFGPETLAESVAEPDNRPQAITVPEAAGILDVHPVLIDVAEKAIATPVEAPG